MLKTILFSCAFILTTAAFGTTVGAGEILFEHSEQQELSRGVTYELNRMMTTNGMLDIHVMTIDLTDPHIYISPVTSERGLGRRETTLNLMRNSGAIGGINADFFGLAGSYSVHFGALAQDGQLLAANAHTNHTHNEFATFFLDNLGNPFFNYMRTNIRFYNNGASNVSINAYNTVGHTLDWPVVIDRLAMENTSELDARFDGLTKIVVNGGAITQVSLPGQTVEIPQNGYVVILPERMAYRSRYFRVGEVAVLEISNTLQIDFSRIQTAIGGGGLLLQNGQTVNDRGVAPAGRQPRSAVGTNANGTQLILMVVDGRSHSVGVTHAELATFMRRWGAVNAMHFDGGGSSTMVTSGRGEGHAVANTPADGNQRPVINALGVFDNAPIGAMVGLSFEMETNIAIVGLPTRVIVDGVDRWGNRLPAHNVNFNSQNEGTWNGVLYTPSRAGVHQLGATLGEFSASFAINAQTLAEIRPVVANISTFEGRRTPIRLTGITAEGVSVSNIIVPGLSVYPSSLGRFENGYFIAAEGGAGYISAVVGNVRAYIGVSVIGNVTPINMGNAQFSTSSHPINGMSMVSVADVEGRAAIRLNYSFMPGSHTQAAYVDFDTPLQIPNGATHLSLQVFGESNGHWLRGRIVAENGQTHLIDFARNVNFEGWQEVVATLPNVRGALVLDQIYVVTLNSAENTHHMTAFAGLAAMFAPTNRVEVPEATRFTDTQHVSAYFTGLPGTVRHNFTMPEEFEYSTVRVADFSVTTLATYNGAIIRTQWANFLQDIREINPQHVVIKLDHNPLNLRQSMEFELFHLAMQELRAEGRTVFVVSATAQETTLTMRDGIRYINLATMEEEASSMSFWVGTNGQIWWN